MRYLLAMQFERKKTGCLFLDRGENDEDGGMAGLRGHLASDDSALKEPDQRLEGQFIFFSQEIFFHT